MSFIKWNESYSTGISEVDEQHKYWISLLEELYESQKNSMGQVFLSELLEKLEDYTHYHFDTEAGLMEKVEYPYLSEHLAEHDIFKSYLVRFKNDIESSNLLTSVKTLDFMKDRMITHILGTDVQYAKHLMNR